MEKDWVSIFITDQEFLAELARVVLEENDIENVIMNQKDKSYQFGEIEVYVHRDNAIRAKYLLKELEN